MTYFTVYSTCIVAIMINNAEFAFGSKRK